MAFTTEQQIAQRKHTEVRRLRQQIEQALIDMPEHMPVYRFQSREHVVERLKEARLWATEWMADLDTLMKSSDPMERKDGR